MFRELKESFKILTTKYRRSVDEVNLIFRICSSLHNEKLRLYPGGRIGPLYEVIQPTISKEYFTFLLYKYKYKDLQNFFVMFIQY